MANKKGTKWTPERTARFRETMAAKKAERMALGKKRSRVALPSPVAGTSVVEAKWQAVNTAHRLIEKVINAALEKD